MIYKSDSNIIQIQRILNVICFNTYIYIYTNIYIMYYNVLM